MPRTFRDRPSFKSSEVLALFLLSMFGTMFVCLILAALKQVFDQLMGYS